MTTSATHGEREWDYLPAAVAAVAGSVAVGYALLIDSQGDSSLLWVLVILGLAAALAAHGTRRSAIHRVGALVSAGLLLIGLGTIALFSIGLPLLVAGISVTAFAAKARSSALPS
ncbi:MAG: hypothetical protein ACT452_01115 [Microthrixaceae bacterium]